MSEAEQENVFYDTHGKPWIKPTDAPTHLRPSAYGAVLDAIGRVLAFRTSRHPWLELPGGGVEDGETSETCLAREGLEEIGVPLRIFEAPLHVHQRRFYDGESGRFCHASISVYLARIDDRARTTFNPQELETLEVLWVDLAETPDEMFHPIFRQAMALLRDRK